MWNDLTLERAVSSLNDRGSEIAMTSSMPRYLRRRNGFVQVGDSHLSVI
jgi:hypothetical protein